MRSFQFFLRGLAAAFLIVSCDESGDSSGELSPFAKNYLSLKMGSMSSNSMNSANGYANAANASFDRIGAQTHLSFGRSKEDSTETKPDTTYYPSPWVSCAVITNIVNRDNSVTTTYDYGDGCMEGNDYFRYFMYGKYTYTYLWENKKEGSVYKDHYAGSYASDNYGGYYLYENDTSSWESNGTSSYSGTSEYDTAKQTYHGVFEHQGNDVYRYNNDIYTYSGKGKSSYNEKGSIVHSNDYTYSSQEYRYQTTVLEPLVTRYDCYNAMDKDGIGLAYCFMPIYVSGREFIRYKQGDEEGSFIIDYGDGECDSIITIIENSTRVEVDIYSAAYNGLYDN